MLFRKVKDLKKRKKLEKKEILNISQKFLSINFLNKNNAKLKSLPIKNFKQKNFSKTKIVRRCIYTYRSRGSIKPYNISRIKFREMLQFGIVPGYKKAVW